jgi:mannose-6-phosphate isomerase
MKRLEGFCVEPQYKERVWGGHDLRPHEDGDAGAPIGEAWIVYEENRVASGPDQGLTLGEMTEKYGPRLLGERSVERTGKRFPVLIKLLDCQDWLSVQVHPDDEKAVMLEGPRQFGKTEAWYFLKVEPGAQIISGLREDITREQMTEGISNGTIIEMVRYQPVERGDTVLTMAGTIHALGPGLLVYEVQQTSDITYRIFDWNRGQREGRALHIKQSVQVSDPTLAGIYRKSSAVEEGKQRLVECPYFALELVASERTVVEMDTRQESFHALTVIEGEMTAEGDGWSHVLGLYETVIVPAEAGAYRLRPGGPFRALVAKSE